MKIKFPKLRRRKKLRASAARRNPLRIAAAADYEEMSEPNMKLSRALLIVLLLHVVAVSGIIAFNAIKTRQSSTPLPVNTAAAPAATTAPSVKPESSISHARVAQKENSRRDETKPSHSIVKEEHKNDHAKKSDAAKPEESGKVYVVAKGDNPVTIAKKLKVPYDDLIALNHIDDPRKLQIGQKLLIPEKSARGKKSE